MSDSKKMLKPCVYCKSDDVETRKGILFVGWCVWCTDCKSEGPIGKSESEAIDKWNDRAIQSVGVSVSKDELEILKAKAWKYDQLCK